MLNMLYDVVLLLLFFITFKLYGIYVATVVGIIGMALQVVLNRLLHGKFDKKQLVVLAVFVIFGGMTLYFHNPIFVKWKPTILFSICGIVFLFTQFIGKEPLTQRMMGHLLEGKTLPTKVWKTLNISWVVFFILLASINLFIAYNFSTDTWVNFKVYGILSSLIVFAFAQAICLARYIEKSDSSNSLAGNKNTPPPPR